MPENETTMRWKIDIAQLKAGMQDAKRSISLANAEFKAATAGLDNWAKSATGLEAKIAQLNKTLPQQKSILSQLEKQYELTAKALGENSSEATKLKIQIENQKGAIAKTEAQISKYNSELTSIIASEESLTKKIADQESELKDLKKTYADIAVQYGKDSKEAQDLANKIQTLSSDLVANKAKMADASAAADKLDSSLVDTGKSAEKAGDGFTVLKGMAANLAAQGLTALYNGVKKLGKELIKTFDEVTQKADDIDKGAQKLGLTAESYQKLSYALELSGSSITDMSKGIKNITLALADTKKGVEGASSKFDALGISLQNADGSMKTTEEVLLEVVDSLADMDDEVSRSAAANDIFGKSYQELAPLLNEGKDGINALMQEAVDYNIVLSNDSVKAAAKYRDSLDKMKSTIDGVKARLIEKLLPALTTIVDGISDLVNGSDTAGEKIKKGVNELFNNIRKAIKKNMPEFYNNIVVPVGKVMKALKEFVNFIAKNFKTIAPIVLSAVAAFTAFNAAMMISKTISAVSAAMSALTAGVGLATKAQVAYNAVLSANPIGAVITAVVALTAAIAYLVSTQKKATKEYVYENEALVEQRDQILRTAEAWDELKAAQEEQVNAGLYEQEHLLRLADELRDITTANGEVKEGYEERADFIIGELNDAYDIEIKKTDNVIENYHGIMNAIEQLAEKKKAQILLDALEAEYQEAVLNKDAEWDKYLEMQDQLAAKKEAITEADKVLAAAQYDYFQAAQNGASDTVLQAYQAVIDAAEAGKQTLITDRDVLEQDIATQKALLENYEDAIAQYQTNFQLFQQGHYDEMTKDRQVYISDFENATDQEIEVLQSYIDRYSAELDALQEMKQKSGGSDIYDDRIKETEEWLHKYQDQMRQYTNTTKDYLGEATLAFSTELDDQLSIVTGHDIDFEDAGEGMVQAYVDGVKYGAPMTKEEAANIAADCIYELAQATPQGKTAGEDLIKGFNSGISDGALQRTAFATMDDFGKRLLSTFKRSLQENSPSKATEDDAVNLLKGLDIGIDKKTPSTLERVKLFGKSVLDTLNGELGDGVSLGGVKSSLKGELDALKGSVAAQSNSISNSGSFGVNGGGDTNTNTKTQNVTFNQTINSPKAVDGLTLYRETNNLLFSAKVRMQNV